MKGGGGGGGGVRYIGKKVCIYLRGEGKEG